MRILFINHNVVWNGTFFRAYHFARYLARMGHDVMLMTTSRSGRFSFRESVVSGVRMLEAPDLLWGRGRTGWDLWNTLRRIQRLARCRYDVIHVFDSRPAAVLPGLWHRRRYGTKLVLDWADWWGRGGTNAERPGRLLNRAIAPLETFFEEAYRPRADGNTVISNALYRRALSLGVRHDLLLRLIQGSDVEEIRPLEQEHARAKLRIPKEMVVVGHLGVLQPRDAAFLLGAHSSVRRKCPDCRLLLIGRHRCDLKRYAGDDGWSQTGDLSYQELIQSLAACDILVLPLADSIANRARWPSRLNDYLAVGRAVVTTDVGDVAALISEHGAGIVTEPQIEGFAEGVARLLKDRDLRVDCGRQGRILAETTLAWPIVTATLENFYARLI